MFPTNPLALDHLQTGVGFPMERGACSVVRVSTLQWEAWSSDLMLSKVVRGFMSFLLRMSLHDVTLSRVGWISPLDFSSLSKRMNGDFFDSMLNFNSSHILFSKDFFFNFIAAIKFSINCEKNYVHSCHLINCQGYILVIVLMRAYVSKTLSSTSKINRLKHHGQSSFCSRLWGSVFQ